MSTDKNVSFYSFKLVFQTLGKKKKQEALVFCVDYGIWCFYNNPPPSYLQYASGFE